MSFIYNEDGIRTSKTVNGVKHTYYLNGSLIMAEQWEDKLLVYLYDASGSPIGMMYRTTSYASNTWDTFWFAKNLFGDIVAIYNESGTKVVSYSYTDAWGNHSVSYSNGGGSTGAQYNPFRYRGYYYDTDLGMYYLQSRYYDARICRFINADGYVSTGQGVIGNNMLAYCNNNPVMYVDQSGCSFESIWDVISLAASVAEVVANPYDPWAWAGLLGDVVDVVIPFVGGIGESVDVVKTACKVIDSGEDIIKTAKQARKTAKATDNIRNSVGTYVILYQKGEHYIGKGGFSRAIQSASNHLKNSNKVTAVIWVSTPNEKSAFVAEYLMQSIFGLRKTCENSYNIIWSPGKNLFKFLQ